MGKSAKFLTLLNCVGFAWESPQCGTREKSL